MWNGLDRSGRAGDDRGVENPFWFLRWRGRAGGGRGGDGGGGKSPTPAAPPKVFVSHASEDKQRFVERFAARLRENGVDAWLDEWEMKPGDSLVDRIFE